MLRSALKAALVLTVVATLAAGTASAQFLPGFRPGLHWVNPMTGQRFSYNFNYSTGYRLNYVNPVTRMPYTFNWQTTWTGLPPSLWFPSHNYGIYATPYTYGGAGTYYNSHTLANPFVREQVRRFAGAGDGGRIAGEGARVGQSVIADQVNYERRGAAAPAGETKVANPALLEPSDDQILSGDVLNDLLGAIRGLEARGTKAESPLLPAELLTNVNMAGGPNADVLMFLRGGRPAFPVVLEGTEYAAIKAELERDLAPVAEAVAAGKRADPAAAERLTATVKKARTALAPAVRDAAIQDGTAVVRFLNALDALAQSARDPEQTGLFPQKWSTVGASVAELVRHMGKFQMTFAPAGAGGEESYYSLHRGLSAYYVALSQPRR